MIKKPTERKKIKKEFRRIEKKVKKKIREKQKKQKIEFRKLKKEKKTDLMKRKLELWKKQGFDVEALFSETEKTKNPTSGIKKLKKQGYDTSVLGDRKI